MKYNKVREFLQNKTLQELYFLQGKTETENIHSPLNNPLSKTHPRNVESRQERKVINLNQTQETIFDEDPKYTATVEIGDRIIGLENKKTLQPRISKTAMSIKKKPSLRKSASLSAKLKVICLASI